MGNRPEQVAVISPAAFPPSTRDAPLSSPSLGAIGRLLLARSDQFSDASWLREEQYADASNLGKRVSLHERYSTSEQGWHPWVFAQLSIPPGAHVLEIGCGPGLLWRQNATRFPPDWTIRLSDFSHGMVAEARSKVEPAGRFSFTTFDAQAIPFPARAFDVVIANHMLYHVPDVGSALRHIARVLTPDGTFYATTNGESHLQELADLVSEASGRVEDRDVFRGSISSFSLQSAPTILKERFGEVALERYEDSLHVTEAEPIVDFVASSSVFHLNDHKLERLGQLVQQRIHAEGAIDITKDPGILIASNPDGP